MQKVVSNLVDLIDFKILTTFELFFSFSGTACLQDPPGLGVKEKKLGN